MNQETLKYIRWAIGDALEGKFDSAIRSLNWAKESAESEVESDN